MPAMLLHVVVLASAAVAIAPAAASDAELQRALSQAACAGARLERLTDQASTVSYSANCTSSSHRKLIVVCAKDACRVSPEREQSEE